jgi:hypothetical protein
MKPDPIQERILDAWENAGGFYAIAAREVRLEMLSGDPTAAQDLINEIKSS